MEKTHKASIILIVEGKNFEPDNNYAHAVANYLNMLVDEEVLTRHDLDKASDDAIEEVVLRIHKNGMNHKKEYLKWDEAQKIKTIFSSETLPNIDIPSKAEITEFVRGFIEFLRPQGFEEITGAIVYGSLLDKRRKPRDGSDLDIMFLVDMDSGWVHLDNAWLQEGGNELDPTDIEVGTNFTEVTKLAYKFAKEKFPKFKDIPVNLSHLYNKKMFEYALDPSDKKEAPWWLYSPGVYAIRGFKDMPEEKVNAIIQKSLGSEWLKKLKRKTIDDIKKDLRYDFGKDQQK